MNKIISLELLKDIIDFISVGNTISNKKLSSLIDAYKYAPNFPTNSLINNSDNYKSKMQIKDISV